MIVVHAPTYSDLRMTVPAREALERAGNRVDHAGSPAVGALPRDLLIFFSTTLTGTVPRGILEVCIGHGNEQHWGLRMTDEPEYPAEWPSDQVQRDYGAWVPCPHRRCGRPLVWYEAGYVPGYRICTRGHHAQLSNDWRSAKAVPR